MSVKCQFYGGPLDGESAEFNTLEVRVVLAFKQVRLVAIYAFKGDRYLYVKTQELGQSASETSVTIAKAVPSIYADGKGSFDGFPVRRWKWKKTTL